MTSFKTTSLCHPFFLSWLLSLSVTLSRFTMLLSEFAPPSHLPSLPTSLHLSPHLSLFLSVCNHLTGGTHFCLCRIKLLMSALIFSKCHGTVVKPHAGVRHTLQRGAPGRSAVLQAAFAEHQRSLSKFCHFEQGFTGTDVFILGALCFDDGDLLF